MVFVALAASGFGATEKVVLQLPYTHQFQFAGLYAAQFKGFFAAEGLEVELRVTTPQRRPVDEVGAGRAQYGVGDVNVLVARLDGQPLVLLATIMQHSPLALMVRAESEIRTPTDLVGKRIALSGPKRFPEILAMLLAEGLRPDQYVIVPDRPEVNELETGQADAMPMFIIDGPFLANRKGLRHRLIRPASYGVDFYGDSLFTSEEEVRVHAARVQAMRRAVLRGWQYALEHPGDVVDWIVVNQADRPPTVTRDFLNYEAARMATLLNADLVPLGYSNPGRWQKTADTLRQLRLGRDPGRLGGFLYAEPETPWHDWAKWLGAALGVVLLGSGLVVLANWRLGRLVEKRTRELRESEARQRELFERAPVPIIEEDYTALAAELERLRAQGVTDIRAHLRARPELMRELFKLKRIVEANEFALERAGFRSVAEMDRRLAETTTDQALDMFVEELGAVWERRDALTLEKTYLVKGGETLHTLVNWTVGSRSGKRDLSRVRLAFTDITSLKQAERALAEGEERYRSLFEANPNPMWIYDPETLRFLAVNEAALRRYGYTREEFLNLSIVDIRPPEEVPRLRELVATFQEGSRYTGVWRHRTKNGEPLLVEISTHTIMLGGRRAVLTVPFDVTEIRRTEAALRESEARHRLLFENAVEGIYRSTPAGQFLALNPAMARLFGFGSAAEMLAWLGNRPTASLYVKPGRRDEFFAALGAREAMIDFESEVHCRDGRTKWISENVRAVRDEAGQLLQLEGFVSDITPRRRLEEEMLRASKLEAVGVLAGGIAHDFNNILTVTLGNLTLAEFDAGPGSRTGRLLQEAKRATLRARELTQQLLTFAKGGDPVRTTVALPEFLRESAEFALHGARSRGEFLFAPDLWPASADKGQLGQVVHNLVLNSVQAMPGGGVVRLGAANDRVAGPGEAGALPPGDYVKITVADSGVGIAPDHLQKVFDPYFTTKQQGSGLGLATVYSIVKKHQGQITVESELGAGTTFCVWLPAAQPAASAAVPAADDTAPLRVRVLLMDDEEPIRQMTRELMARIGGGCETTADGAAAVSLFQAERAAGRTFDVVILDLTVPGAIGGREALEQLRLIDPAVRAVVSSGYSRDTVLANFREHGFCGILPKPYGLEQLRRVLREVLAESPTQPLRTDPQPVGGRE